MDFPYVSLSSLSCSECSFVFLQRCRQKTAKAESWSSRSSHPRHLNYPQVKSISLSTGLNHRLNVMN